MAAVTLLGTQTFTTAAGSKTVTATPAVGDLLIIITAHTGVGSSDLPTDNQGGTYSLIAQSTWGTNGTGRMVLFVRNSLVSSAVSTIFTHDPTPSGTSTGGGLAVLKVTGMSKSGTGAIRASTGAATFAAAATPAPILSNVPLTANPVIAAMWNATSPAGMTPRTGYTELVDVGYGTPTTGLEIMSRDSGETSATITWGSASASAGGSLVAELDASTLSFPPFNSSAAFAPLIVR